METEASKFMNIGFPRIYFNFLLMQEAVRISKENDSLQSEVCLFIVWQKYAFKISLWGLHVVLWSLFKLNKTLNELEECRHNLNSCLEENAKLSRLDNLVFFSAKLCPSLLNV